MQILMVVLLAHLEETASDGEGRGEFSKSPVQHNNPWMLSNMAGTLSHLYPRQRGLYIILTIVISEWGGGGGLVYSLD